MDRLALVLVLFLGLSVFAAVFGEAARATQNISPLPSTPARPVTQEYHGTTVTDPYPWLENAADPEVWQWTEQENRHTCALLDKFPGLPALRAQIKKWLTASSTDYSGLQYRGGKLFAMKNRRQRRAGGSCQLAQDGHPPSGRDVVRQTDPAASQLRLRPRRRHVAEQGDRSASGRVRVSVSAVGNRVQAIRQMPWQSSRTPHRGR